MRVKPAILKLAIVVATLGLSNAASAGPATIILPSLLAPIDIGPQQYDQGLVYSSALLDQQQAAGMFPGNTSVFDFAVGSGNLGVITYSHNAPANSSPFQAAMEAGTSGDFDGVWGMGTANTVGALRALLTVGGVKYQPLFVFDHNEQSTLRVSGRMAIYRGVTQQASYALDTNTNGSYDAGAYITSCDNVAIGPAVPATPDGCNINAPVGPYSWGTNGSGKPDYFALFNTFDLYSAAYLDSDSFVIEMSLRDMDPGFDELGIAGYLFAEGPGNPVPEPGMLGLIALGLLAAAASRRRKSTR